MPTFEMIIGVPFLIGWGEVPESGNGWDDPKIPAHVEIDEISVAAKDLKSFLAQIENDNAEEIYAAAVEDAKLRREFKKGRRR